MFIYRFLAFLLIPLALAIVPSSFAATLEVPNQYSTIASALNTATPGDIVQLEPGHYYEHDLVLPEGITLVGLGESADETTIDGSGQGRILTACFLEATSYVRNITFENGWAQNSEGYESCGGAIYINDANVMIAKCRFLNNQAQADGGAICIMRANSAISDCTFQNNRAGEGGGALDCSYLASPVIRSSTFRQNTAAYGGALSCRGDSKPLFHSCQFDQNTTSGDFSHGGAALTFFWGAPDFRNCTFSRNSADIGGAIFADSRSPADLVSCTVTENIGHSLAPGIFTQNNSPQISSSLIVFHDGVGLLSQGPELPLISCTDIFGNAGGNWVGEISRQAGAMGNLEVDPMFCESNTDQEYQYQLEIDSPCSIDGGACDDMGAWSVGCDSHYSDVIDQPDSHLPRVLTIEDLGAWPNPFNPQTQVHFLLSSSQQVKVEVYGIDGRRLRTLADRTFESGPQNLSWNGQDNTGRVMASGPYIVVVRGERDTHKLKVTLLK